MKKVGLIGFGRFGEVLYNLLKKDFSVLVYDSREIKNDAVNFSSLNEVLDCLIIFIATPISTFKECVKEISINKLYNTTIIDVCSVKVYPVRIMEEYLQKNVGIIASHPHFGPDSFSPFRELKITLYPVRDLYNRYDVLKDFFEKQSIRTINITPDEHDKMAASSQGITHFIGRVLEEFGIRSTEINTLGFAELLSVVEQTCNDSWDLFRDLQKYNPYTNEMIDNLVDKISNLHSQIKNDAN